MTDAAAFDSGAVGYREPHGHSRAPESEERANRTAFGAVAQGRNGGIADEVSEYGIAVAVTSNIPHADTFSLTVKIAEAFAAQPR